MKRDVCLWWENEIQMIWFSIDHDSFCGKLFRCLFFLFRKFRFIFVFFVLGSKLTRETIENKHFFCLCVCVFSGQSPSLHHYHHHHHSEKPEVFSLFLFFFFRSFAMINDHWSLVVVFESVWEWILFLHSQDLKDDIRPRIIKVFLLLFSWFQNDIVNHTSWIDLNLSMIQLNESLIHETNK